MLNKLFTINNGPLYVTPYNLQTGQQSSNDPAQAPQPFSTLDNLPLGTSDRSSTGEIGVKVIQIADLSTNANGMTGTPVQTPIAASTNQTIPIGAKNWWYAILTGSATIAISGSGSITVAAPYTYTSRTILAGATVNVAAAASSSAAIGWDT